MPHSLDTNQTIPSPLSIVPIRRFVLALVFFLGFQAGADDLPESWVEEAPDNITRQSFEPSRFAPLITMDEDGSLQYNPFSDRGDRLLDWSFCGYMRSEQPIPDVPVVETLEPRSGEISQGAGMAYPKGPTSHVQIQSALDRVGALEADADGIRGAVLLKRGIYFISEGLKVPSGSGISTGCGSEAAFGDLLDFPNS